MIDQMHENEIAREIVNIAYKMHTQIGPGLLESVYERVMQFELKKLGFAVQRQRGVPFVYEEIRMPIGFRADLVVNNKDRDQIGRGSGTVSRKTTQNVLDRNGFEARTPY